MKKYQSFANSNRHRAAFNVVYQSATRTLTIPAGKFRMAGVDYELKADEEVVFPTLDRKTAFVIYLVDMGGSVRVLSDTVSDIDPPIDLGNSFIKALHRVALVEFADPTADAEVSVYYIDPVGSPVRIA